MNWRIAARWVAALAGVGAVALVATHIGTRPARVVLPAPQRLDPEARVESTGAITTQIKGVKEDYQIKSAHQFLYADGTSGMREVEIIVKDRGGRDFLMQGHEAKAGAGNSSLDLAGQVVLRASDGFQIETGEAHYAEADGLVHAPGAFTFRRGLMEGTGVGMTYDKAADVLTIAEQAHILFKDEAGTVTTDVQGGTASLDRAGHVLGIDGGARALRGEQTLEAGRLTARLSEDNEHVTFMELRGKSRVAGGSAAFDAMTAESIDLAYSDDGALLERVMLNGKAAVALNGGAPGTPGRQFFGDHLAFTLADGKSVTSLTGQGAVRLDLPAVPPAPKRAIAARQVAATGTPEGGLTRAEFSGAVTFRETPAGAGAKARSARSSSLAIALSAESVTRAVFGGGVTFEEDALHAAAATADYDPTAGTLALDGHDSQGAPRLEDARVSVNADHIGVTLETHQMTATGHVQTTIRDAAGGGTGPGLLDKKQPARVTADAFTSPGGDTGAVTYAGAVQLVQGDSTIRTDKLTIERQSGDLNAEGTARATFTLDNGTLTGRADRIRYVEASRSLEYGSAKPGPTPAQLNGPQGDLRADRITLTLGADSHALERMEATGRMALKVDTRTIRATRLRYTVAGERYDMDGTAAAPVTVTQGCDSTTGRTLTWYRTTDRMLVDGREAARTQTRSRGGPCPEPRTP